MFNVLISVKYRAPVGCFIHLAWYACAVFSNLEGKDPHLNGRNYKLRHNAIEKCAHVANERGHNLFAVQDDGKYLGSPASPETVFFRFGWIKECNSHGKGVPGVVHVYVVGELKGIDHVFFINLVETKDAILAALWPVLTGLLSK